MAGQSWMALIAALDGLPGLSTAEKGKARVLLLRKSQEEASVLVSGLPDVAAEAIKEILRQEDAAAVLGTTRAGSATPNADAQPPVTMAALKEVLEGQAATTKQALEGQAATTKQALEAVKEALTDSRAVWRFPVSTVDWNQLEQSWAAYLTEVPIKKKVS